MPNVGDAVLYSVQGKTYNALVLFAHSGQVDHLGAADEPLLHLAFIAPDRESETAKNKIGYLPQVFIEYDVVHASHEFSESYKEKHGLVTAAQIAAQRGQGQWMEMFALHTPEIADVIAERDDAENERDQAWKEIEKLKAALAAVPEDDGAAVPDATGFTGEDPSV